MPDLSSSSITDLSDTCIPLSARASRHGHRGGVLWLTGLSGAGKSTLAQRVEQDLFARGYEICLLDGDALRRGLSADLGFSHRDRSENIRRVGAVARLFADAGLIAITALISPYRADRAAVRTGCGSGFHEIFIKAGLEVCEHRDPKGLYKKARAGLLLDFTGIDAPYETPLDPDLTVDTETTPIETCVQQITTYAEKHFALPQR